MKDFIKNPINLNKIEFWAATTMFIFSVFFLVAKASSADPDALHTPYKWTFGEYKAQYSFFSNYFFPQIGKYVIFYTSFLVLNFYITPRVIKRKDEVLTFFLILLAISFMGLMLGVSDTYLKAFLLVKYKSLSDAYNFIFQTSFIYTFWLVMMLALYSIIKYTAQYLLLNSQVIQSKYQIISREGLMAFVLWMISVFLLLISNAPKEVVSIWSVLIIYGIGIYCYSLYDLIPQALKKKKPFSNYLLKILLICTRFYHILRLTGGANGFPRG